MVSVHFLHQNIPHTPSNRVTPPEIYLYYTNRPRVLRLFPLQEFQETSLHHAISQETGGSLHIVDFLVQNSSNLDRKTKEGNTPLHYCVIQNQPEAMRLLLRSGASPDLPNNNGKTPLSIARERGYHLCEELVSSAVHCWTDSPYNYYYSSSCTLSPVRRQCSRMSTSTGIFLTMTAPRTSLTRRLWRIIPGPSPGPRTRRAPGPCPSSPPACPGRRRSLRLTTDPTAVPLTGHGPTPLTAETRPGATGTRSCLLPLLPSLKSPPCVSSFYNSHPVALIHYLVGFSILSCGLEQVNSLGDKCSVLSSAESLTRYFHFSVVIHSYRAEWPHVWLTCHVCFSVSALLFYITIFSFWLQPGYTHCRQSEERQITNADPSHHIQHPPVQPRPLPAQEHLRRDDLSLPQPLAPAQPQEVAQQRLREPWLQINNPRVLPSGENSR